MRITGFSIVVGRSREPPNKEIFDRTWRIRRDRIGFVQLRADCFNAIYRHTVTVAVYYVRMILSNLPVLSLCSNTPSNRRRLFIEASSVVASKLYHGISKNGDLDLVDLENFSDIFSFSLLLLFLRAFVGTVYVGRYVDIEMFSGYVRKLLEWSMRVCRFLWES